MEAEGLVSRTADDKDLRQVRVHITEKGLEKAEFIRRKCEETEKIMLEGFSREDKEELVSLLRRVLSNLVEKEEERA